MPMMPSDDELQRLIQQAAPQQPTMPIKQITLNAVNIGIQRGEGGLVLTLLLPTNGEAYVIPLPNHVGRAVGNKMIELAGPAVEPA